MPSLRESQLELRDAILAGARHANGGLEVYRYAFGARLAGVLRSNYPVLARRLGELEFARLARRYIAETPSRHFNIRWYGAQLSRHLRGAYADLARMEWALGLAFDAADETPLAWDALKSRPVEDWVGLPIALHPSTQVLSMSWSAEALWEGTAIEHRRNRHALLVWRKDLQAHWRIASRSEALALRALRFGTLADACDAAPEAAFEQVGEWFAGWVREGMLVEALT